ncbi:MAG: Hpt domain-containing protein [Hymenobacteraceae bacterium]|nr:Hpt domain-containing protein [Hymenobacteraceae bacterium]
MAEAAPQLEQAARDLAAGRVSELLAPVHQLKGASAQLGLSAFADVARTLEQQVRLPNPQAAAVQPGFDKLRAMFTTFAAIYPRFLPPPAA